MALTPEQFKASIEKQAALLAYFSTPNCGICHALKPKIKEFISRDYPKVEFIEIDCDQSPTVAAQWSVFQVPVVILFFQGKESLRLAKSFSIAELKAAIDRPYQLLF